MLSKHVHSKLEEYSNLDRADNFRRAIVLQILFAYHVAYHKLNFVHGLRSDSPQDNFWLMCRTTWTQKGCAQPDRGTLIFCFDFGAAYGVYCVDLHDTMGTI